MLPYGKQKKKSVNFLKEVPTGKIVSEKSEDGSPKIEVKRNNLPVANCQKQAASILSYKKGKNLAKIT